MTTEPSTAAASREGIGVRVARWRRTAGMTQEQLAAGVGRYLDRSYSQAMISQIEQGRRPVDKRSVLFALANTLRVSVTDLVGQPYPPTVTTDLDLYMVVPDIRAALDEPDEPVQPRSLAALAFAVDQAMGARMACDYLGLGRLLPGVLAEARELWLTTQDPLAGKLLVQACVTGALTLKPAGWIDLAMRLADLAEVAAGQLDDPACIAAARYTTAQCALAAGNRRRSLGVAVGAAAVLAESEADAGDRSAWGTMLYLHAALSAASLHQGVDAEGYLAEAGVLAGQVPGDPWRMEACPANVATWAVGIALENGEPERAPALARRVDITGLRTPQRRARLHMDTGRALFLAGNAEAAVRAFLAADDAAPGDLRMRPTAVELVGQMVRDAPVRGGSDALRALAVRVGVDPFAPPEPAV